MLAGLGAVLATAGLSAVLATAVPAPGAATVSAAAGVTVPGVRLGAGVLGVNVAPWDYSYAPGAVAAPVMQRMIARAGIGMLHYGGGSWADYYDWRTNTDIQKCLPGHAAASFTGPCATGDALDFAGLRRQARAIGAASFVTVNYGSGTPAEAAAWVAQARKSQQARKGQQADKSQGVALWEVGNESYGCWEVNNELVAAPERYRGYTPDTYTVSGGVRENKTCPQATQGNAKGTQTLADSYAAHSPGFLKAMKKADPAALIGVPWAFGPQVPGASVPYADEWNRTVLRADGRYAGFVDARWYPFSFSGTRPDSQRILRSLTGIPALYASIRRTLARYDPAAGVVVGETGITNHTSTVVCDPVGAVFAAGDVLAWLAAGARSVDWFDLNNYGNNTAACRNADNGLLTSSAPPAAEAPYWGYLLASKLARPGASLAAIGVSAPRDVLAYEALLSGGGRAVALLNTSATARTVTFRPFAGLSGNLRTWTYAAGDQNPAASRIVTGTTPTAAVARGVTLPPESVKILETG